jgi:hypothetical protein
VFIYCTDRETRTLMPLRALDFESSMSNQFHHIGILNNIICISCLFWLFCILYYTFLFYFFIELVMRFELIFSTSNYAYLFRRQERLHQHISDYSEIFIKSPDLIAFAIHLLSSEPLISAEKVVVPRSEERALQVAST